MTAFSPGDTIVLQEVWRGKVWAARPMRVVEDDGDLVALWFPRGTRWKAPTSGPARPWNSDRGERLAACAERDEPPFCEPWAEWQPLPEWEQPELPEGWERLCR